MKATKYAHTLVMWEMNLFGKAISVNESPDNFLNHRIIVKWPQFPDDTGSMDTGSVFIQVSLIIKLDEERGRKRERM